MIDTSVLVAGIGAFRGEPPRSPSAALLGAWTRAPAFIWLVSDDILAEYVDVLRELKVRSEHKIVSLIHEEADVVEVTTRIPRFARSGRCAFLRMCGGGCGGLHRHAESKALSAGQAERTRDPAYVAATPPAWSGCQTSNQATAGQQEEVAGWYSGTAPAGT